MNPVIEKLVHLDREAETRNAGAGKARVRRGELIEIQMV